LYKKIDKICKMAYVIGVDVGGTNTDTVILCSGRVVAKAKFSTTEETTGGVVNSIRAALDSLSGEDRADVLNNLDRVSIGTTHFTNAVKKRDGSSLDRVAVIRLCGSASRALPPFSDFPDDLKDLVFGGEFMIKGGLEYDGREIDSIDPDELRECARRILSAVPPVKNVVVSGVFAPCDEKQEKLVEEILINEHPELSYTLSYQVRARVIYMA
jgi:N-methylhydantoinase A/oxoprolinase/acetone carboxylase beta subunit